MRRFLLALFTLVILATGGFFGYKYFSQKSEVATTKAKAEEKNVPMETKKVNLDEASLMKTQTPTDKTWEFGFDEELDASSVNTSNVEVTDDNGKKVGVTPSLTNGNKTLQINPPSEGYKKGGSYNLLIKNGITYASGKPVSKPFSMKFIVERDEVEKGKYSDKLIMVKEEQIQSSDENSLVLDKGIKKGLKVNDIIVVPSKKNDVGKALKITSIKSTGSTYTVEVTKPAFSELFDKLDIYKSYPIKPENITLAKGVEGVAIEPISEATPTTMIASSNTPTHNGEYAMPKMNAGYSNKSGFQFKFNDLKIPLDKDKEIEATVEGSLAMLAPRVNADVNISFGQMKRLMFSQKGHMEQETTITMTGLEKEKIVQFNKKNKDKLRKEVKIGTIKIPVPYVPGLFIEGNVLMEVRMSASGEPKITFSVEIDDEKGVLYEHDKVTPTFDFKPDVNITYSGKANGVIKFGPAGQIALSALEVVGAGIESFEAGKLEGEIAAEASTIKENYHVCLSGAVGFVSEASVYVDVLKLGDKQREKIAEAELPEWEIWKKDINTCELYKELIPSKKEITLNAGEQTNLQLSATKTDILKLKTVTQKIKNHKDLKVTPSKKGAVTVEKTKNGLVIKALKQPTAEKTVLKIEYNTEKSSFSNKQHLEVKVPITIKGYEETQTKLDGKYASKVGVLNIKDDKEDSFVFNINISGQGSPVNIVGGALKTKDVATFTEPDSGCVIKFSINKGSIGVHEETTGKCMDLHSPSIDTNGVYVKISDKPEFTSEPEENSPEDSTSEAETNSDTVESDDDQKIRNLLGSDYQMLLESTKEYEDAIVDQDGWGADTAYGMTEKGVKESVIISDVKYKYVALIIDGSKVRFYTNNPAYKSKLPITVENWRNGFKDYPVEYVYKDI